jgi:hypothetical protein
MSTPQPFLWRPSTAKSQWCEWGIYRLEAFYDGRWRVSLHTAQGHALADHTTQYKGSTISEAKTRAQAAAMIQKQLAQNKA